MAFTIVITDDEDNTATLVVTDEDQIAGVNSAREQYNLDNAETENFTPIETNADYMKFVDARAIESYGNHYRAAR